MALEFPGFLYTTYTTYTNYLLVSQKEETPKNLGHKMTVYALVYAHTLD